MPLSPELTAHAALDLPPREPGLHAVTDVAARLEVGEGQLRGWLTTFQWERRFDGAGHLLLDERDVEFLRLIKSLREVDRSCASIVRLIADEPLPEPAPAGDDGSLDQRETLKAALKDLHPTPPRRHPWAFWRRG